MPLGYASWVGVVVGMYPVGCGDLYSFSEEVVQPVHGQFRVVWCVPSQGRVDTLVACVSRDDGVPSRGRWFSRFMEVLGLLCVPSQGWMDSPVVYAVWGVDVPSRGRWFCWLVGVRWGRFAEVSSHWCQGVFGCCAVSSLSGVFVQAFRWWFARMFVVQTVALSGA